MANVPKFDLFVCHRHSWPFQSGRLNPGQIVVLLPGFRSSFVPFFFNLFKGRKTTVTSSCLSHFLEVILKMAKKLNSFFRPLLAFIRALISPTPFGSATLPKGLNARLRAPFFFLNSLGFPKGSNLHYGVWLHFFQSNFLNFA